MKLEETFASKAFTKEVMKKKLPKETYLALEKSIADGSLLSIEVANIVATAMKEWAIEKGATHFTHWFQPMTGITAEKHEAFVSVGDDGKMIMDFSAKELVRGEPDASSFPSGGIRSTFEARGYTVWDTTSYAFVRDDTLYIPTAFCSFGGESLDKKTPLLKSMVAVEKESLRILRLLGDTTTKKVLPVVGAEQEYFLIDKSVYQKRQDLVLTGRTLLGARAPKGQDLDDHYFGSIKPRVSEYMKELEEQLWDIGIFAKTRHNEVAPGQYELAPIFTTTNVATDNNQVTMDIMKTLADKHGLVCLLHEKPFAGVNGSGKHNNFSLTTDTGKNMYSPGKNPSENTRFLLFLAATIKAVDEYQDLLRISSASAANDHRLGANEAPPAIISIFLGDELSAVIEAITEDKDFLEFEKKPLKLGLSELSYFTKDTTDRNRTSPFAFTGNKFEFRMVGSSFSIAGPNIFINTIIANSLRLFADELEKSNDVKEDIKKIIKETFIKHKRILFSGNSYMGEWEIEAEKRGLLNLKNTVDALPHYIKEKNIKLFEENNVMSSVEVNLRYEILMETYCKTIHIEALTLIDMTRKEILSSILKYEKSLLEVAMSKKSLDIDYSYEEETIKSITGFAKDIAVKVSKLEALMVEVKNSKTLIEEATFYRDEILAQMNKIRFVIDEVELSMPNEFYSLPTYYDIFNSIN